MDTIGKIITDISYQLNDQQNKLEFTRWSRSIFVTYMNQAFAEIGAYRPEAFPKTVEVTLVPGSKQSISGYISITGVESLTGRPANNTDATLFKAFAAYTCCDPPLVLVNGTPVYNVKSYAIDMADEKTFYVDPPVPSGVVAKVKISVIAQPPHVTLADWNKLPEIDGKYYNNLIDFMQARAYELDSESPNSRANSQMFFSRFYQAMGVKYKIDSAFKSGYYQGQTGTGDPRAAIR